MVHQLPDRRAFFNVRLPNNYAASRDSDGSKIEEIEGEKLFSTSESNIRGQNNVTKDEIAIEIKYIKEELQNTLKELTYSKLAETDASLVENTEKVLQKIPNMNGIYVG